MQLDFSTLSANQIYHTVIQTIIPRPIAWVLSENESGDFNLAPFSYFTAVASDPALLMFSIGKKLDSNGNKTNKDTLKNIQERKDFVVHIAHTELAKQLNLSSANLDYGESELGPSGLSTTPLDDSRLPRIAEAKIAFACSLFEIKEIGNAPMSLVFGRIHSAYICDSIIEQQGKRSTINANELNPLARLGGNDYTSINQAFTIARPK